MPDYNYQCQSCKHEFTIHVSIAQHTEKDCQHRIRCPKCYSTDVKHLIESVNVTTAKKS